MAYSFSHKNIFQACFIIGTFFTFPSQSMKLIFSEKFPSSSFSYVAQKGL